MSAPLTAAGPSAAAEAKQPEKAQSVRGQFFAPEKGSAESVTAGVGAKPAHAPCGLAEKVSEQRDEEAQAPAAGWSLS